MKPLTIATILLAFFIAGCQPSTPPSAALANPAPSSSVASQIPSFEIRDFTIDEKKEAYGTTYNGRGTLITKNPALSKGSFLVWLSGKQAHKNDEELKTLILLKDGIGTLKTFEFLNKDEREKKSIKYFEWQILGYSPLLEGVMIQSSQTTSK